MFGARTENFETLLFRTPLENVDVDITRAPAFHLQFGRLVEVDRACSDESCSVVVDNEFLSRATDSEPRTEREYRPIRSRAHHVVAGQIFAERIAHSALFFSRVSGSTNIRHASEMRIGRFDGSQRFLYNRLFGATDEKTASRKSYCKVKAFRHLRHRR